jgi:hypothetical protein
MFKEKSSFDRVISCIGQLLSPLGFNRKGSNFVLTLDSAALVIQVQKSTSGSSASPRITVNLGLVCALLASETDLRNARPEDSHLRLRIGSLLPSRPDKWWELHTDADAQRACLEINTILSERAIPFLSAYLTPDALLALWETGESPGITNVQRVRYLEQLKSRLS